MRVCAVIGDGDEAPDRAFLSLRQALAAGGLDVPPSTGAWTTGCPVVGLMLQPGTSRAGHLQTMIQDAISGGADPAISCVSGYLDCVTKTVMPAPRDRAKAYVQAYLASREHAGLSIGSAADKGYLTFDSPAYDEVRGFLRSMPT